MAPPSPMGPGWVRGLNYTRHTPLRARLAPFLVFFLTAPDARSARGWVPFATPPAAGGLGAAALLGLGAFLRPGRRAPLGAPHGHSSSSSKKRLREPMHKKRAPRIIAAAHGRLCRLDQQSSPEFRD